MMPGEIIGLQDSDMVCGTYSAVTMHLFFRNANSITSEACRVDFDDPVNAKVRAAGLNKTKALEIIADSYNLEGQVRNCSKVVEQCSVREARSGI